VFFLRIVNRGFSLIRLIILARILSPNDFGLMGIALLTMSTLETFSQTGFQAALIQKKEDIESYLNSAWTVLILRGFALFIILYFIAPYAALFFDAPKAKSIIRVIGFAVLFRAFNNIGITYFKKELEFNKEFIYQFSGTLADFIVAILAVLILRNVWALVFGLLAGNIVRCVMSYFIHPYRPHLSSDLKKIKELFGFGKWIFVQTIVLFFLTQGDDAFVGKIIGTTALGFYQLAYQISNMPATEITHVVSQVTFPAYSKLQEHGDKLKKALTKTLKLTTFITIPIASGIFILAPEFTRAFLGDKWMQMVPAMQVMCLFGAMRSVGATFGPIYRGIARVDIALKINVAQLIFLAAIIYPLSLYWGILGIAVAITLSMVLALFLTSKRIINLLDISFMSLYKPVFLSTLASIGMILIISFLKTYVLKSVNIDSVVSLSVIGGICYLGFMFVMYRASGHDLRSSIKTFHRYYNGR